MAVFQPFGPDHWLVLGITGALVVGCVVGARRLRRLRDDRAIRVAFACALVANEVASWIYFPVHGVWALPFQVCDLSVFLTAWALLRRNRTVGELVLCWGLAGSSQALVTPDLAYGFLSFPWVNFFLGHCGIVVGAVYLAARGRAHLSTRSVWRVFAITNVYVALAGLVNWGWGTNLGYLAGKPAHPSLLDLLGPWPYYIVGMEVIGLGLFFVCLGVSRFIEWRAAS